jgi:hypothetical protein
MRDTVQELGQTLKNSTVTFQLVNPADSGMPHIIEKADRASAKETELGAHDG